jgi:cytochrome P450 family 6
MALLEILVLLALVLFNVATFLFYHKQFKFWKKLGVPFPKPTFIFGNIYDVVLLRRHFGYVMQSIYQQMKDGKHDGYCGMFFASEPVMLVLTPEFAKTVLATDFQYFSDRGLYNNPKIDPMSSNLFFLKGWLK